MTRVGQEKQRNDRGKGKEGRSLRKADKTTEEEQKER